MTVFSKIAALALVSSSEGHLLRHQRLAATTDKCSAFAKIVSNDGKVCSADNLGSALSNWGNVAATTVDLKDADSCKTAAQGDADPATRTNCGPKCCLDLDSSAKLKDATCVAWTGDTDRKNNLSTSAKGDSTTTSIDCTKNISEITAGTAGPNKVKTDAAGWKVLLDACCAKPDKPSSYCCR